MGRWNRPYDLTARILSDDTRRDKNNNYRNIVSRIIVRGSNVFKSVVSFEINLTQSLSVRSQPVVLFCDGWRSLTAMEKRFSPFAVRCSIAGRVAVTAGGGMGRLIGWWNTRKIHYTTFEIKKKKRKPDWSSPSLYNSCSGGGIFYIPAYDHTVGKNDI